MRGNSLFIDNQEYCYFCGAKAHGTHHMIFGTGVRDIADVDGVFAPICDECHTIGKSLMGFSKESRIHDNVMAEKLSKMLGQCMWEKHQVAEGITEEAARVLFRRRYGKSYL